MAIISSAFSMYLSHLSFLSKYLYYDVLLFKKVNQVGDVVNLDNITLLLDVLLILAYHNITNLDARSCNVRY